MNTLVQMTIQEIRRLLHSALRSLSGVCDGALSLDGVGFNGGDSHFGKQLAASNPDRWSPKQTFCVAKMLRKYANQLSGRGIDISGVPLFVNVDAVSAFSTPPPLPTEQPALIPVPAANLRKVEPMPEGYWKVSFPYAPALVAGIKALPWKMRQWDGAGRFWLVKIHSDNAEQLTLAAGEFTQLVCSNGFEYPEAFLEEMHGRVAKGLQLTDEARANEEESFATDCDLVVPGLGLPLRPFQKSGVKYASRVQRCIIGDEMGLGKTPQCLATFQNTNAFPALVVCRATLKPNWLKESAKFLPGRSVSGNPFDKAEITILTHHELTKHQEWLLTRRFVGIAFDESQDFKNGKAQRTKAARLVAGGEVGPRIRLCLSGTPILNRPAELISQLQIINQLGAMGGWKFFTQHYCAAYQTAFGMELGGAANLEELNRKLRETCYIRRLKKDVLKELPDKTRDVVGMPLDNMAAYRQTQDEVSRRLGALMLDANAETARVAEETRGMELAELISFALDCWPNISKAQELEWLKEEKTDKVRGFIMGQMERKENATASAGAIMLLGKLMERAGEGKVAGVVEWAEDAMESGRKLILFANHRSVQQKLWEAIPGAIWTRDTRRFKTSQEAVDAFQNTDAPVIVCSLKGDNAGLNITAADMVGFIERDYVPATMAQAEDRAHRIGQKNAVNVYYFDAPGTIDDMLVKILGDKAAIVDAASNGNLSQADVRKAVTGSLISALLKKK